MARDLTTGMVTGIDSGAVRPVLLVTIALATHTACLFSGVGKLTWNGQTFLGTADLGKISDLTETTSQTSQGASLSISGIDKTLLGESLAEIKLGRPVCIYLGLLTEVGALIPDPYLIFKGRMGKPTATPGTDTCTITIAVENRLDDQQHAQVSRYTPEDQRRNYPNDSGLDFTPQLADAAWQWGA